MSDQLRELDLWWIVTGREVAPTADSTEQEDVAAYNKRLRKCSRTTARIRNAMEPDICAQYASDIYDEDPKGLWEKLADGYRKALGLELYYFRRSHFESSLEAHGTVAKYIHEIDRIVECLREAEQVIKPEEKTFYLLNGLPPSWREWRDLQASVIKPDNPEELVAAIKAREASLNQDQAASSDTVLAVDSQRLAGRGAYKGGKKAEQGRFVGERHGRSSTDLNITCY